MFVTSALGIVPAAALMSESTEQLAARSGPGIGGLVNVTFGNAPESSDIGLSQFFVGVFVVAVVGNAAEH